MLPLFCCSAGKWNQGLSCASRNDHCYHPLNHGFDYFYGHPFGLLSDCRNSETPELHRGLRAQLWVATVVLGLLPLLLLVPKFAGSFAVPWKVILPFGLLALLFFTAWYSSYGFVRRWNCILMRNHEIVQQPLREDRLASLLLKEALSFIDRYAVDPGLTSRRTVSIPEKRDFCTLVIRPFVVWVVFGNLSFH